MTSSYKAGGGDDDMEDDDEAEDYDEQWESAMCSLEDPSACSAFAAVSGKKSQEACCSCDEWAVSIMNNVPYSAVAVGHRNMYAPELPPGSSVSCMRSSLAFLRSVFMYGLQPTVSSDAIDGMLLQGREWTAALSSDGSPFRTCDAHELPRRIRNADGSALVVAFSTTYGETQFYADDAAPAFLDTQTSARKFFDTVWKTRATTADSASQGLYCLFIVGAIGVGIVRADGAVFIFDPHGHGVERRSLIVKVQESDLYKYITSYADPAADPYWSATFVYFITAASHRAAELASEADVASAVSRLYGTSDVAFERRKGLPGEDVDAVPAFEPPDRPFDGKVTFVIIDGGESEKARGGVIDEDEAIASASPSPIGDSWEDALDDVGAGNWSGALSVVDQPSFTGSATASSSSVPPPASSSAPSSADGSGTRHKHKRRRPIWSPPSSTEDVTVSGDAGVGNKDGRRSSRKYRRRPGSGERIERPMGSATLSGSSSELAEVAAGGVTYAPAQTARAPDDDGGGSGSGDEIADKRRLGKPSLKAASEAMRQRTPLNPHVASGISSGPEGLWSDEYMRRFPMDGLREKTRDAGEAAAAAADAAVHTGGSRGTTPLGSLMGACSLEAFERLFAYVVENGTRTHPEAPSAISAEVEYLTAAFPLETAFGAFVSASGLALSEARAHSELFRQMREEDAPTGRLVLAKLAMVAADVETATENLHSALDAAVQQEGDADAAAGYERVAVALASAADQTHGPGLYAETVASRPGETMSERVAKLCSSVREKEDASRLEGVLIRSELDSIDRGVTFMTKNMDSFAMGGDPEAPGVGAAVRATADSSVTRTPSRPSAAEFGAELSDLSKSANGAVWDAVREYYFRVALYSAKAVAADGPSDKKKKSRRSEGTEAPAAAARYALVSTPRAESISRMAASLPMLDAALNNAAALLPGTSPPPSVSKSPAGRLLIGLVQAGSDLSTEQRLTEWLDLMRDAQKEGILDRRELTELLERVTAINRAAAKSAAAASSADLLAAFYAAADAAAKYAGAEESFDEVALAELASRLETVGRTYAALEESAARPGGVPVPQDARDAAADAAARLAVTRARMDEMRNTLARVRAELGGALRPLKDFAGLRVAGRTFRDLGIAAATAIGYRESRGSEALDVVLRSGPPETVGQLKSDLSALFSQYRSALERPNRTTASALSGLGKPFTVAVRIALGSSGGYPEASVFFARHADSVAAAVSDAVAHPEDSQRLRAAAGALADAAAAVEKTSARVVRAASDSEFAAAAAAERRSAFDFLGALRNKYIAAAEAADRESEAAAAVRTLRSVADDASRLTAEIKSSDPEEGPRPRLFEEARTAAENAISAVIASRAVVDRLAGERRAEVEKAASAADARAAELSAAWTSFEAARANTAAARVEETWRAASEALLADAEERSLFDADATARLAAAGAKEGFAQTQQTRKRANAVLEKHRSATLQAVEAVLKFNPYDPETANADPVAQLASVKDLTWGDAFIAASSAFGALFAVNAGPLTGALRAAAAILIYSEGAAVSGARIDYRDMISVLEREADSLPFLRKYADYYRRGRDECDALFSRLETARATVAHAVGRLPSEITAALEEAASVRSPEAAKSALAAGALVNVQAERDIRAVGAALERETFGAYAGTAYERAAKQGVKRELDATAAALKEAEKATKEASSRASAILNEVASAADAVDRDAAEGLANLKNLLRLVPPPAYAAKALDAASSVDDVVTQMALLLAKTEETKELDVGAVDWLRHAKSVVDTHPATMLIDETGPATPYEERVHALVELRSEMDALKSSLCAAETEWDEAWAHFTRDKDKVTRSYEGLEATRRASCRLQAATNMVLALRSDSVYSRLPEKMIARIEAKRAERDEAFAATAEFLDHIITNRRALDAVLDRIPVTFDAEELRNLARKYDELAPTVPKWYSNAVRRYRTLVDLRLNMYAAYASMRQRSAGMGSGRPTSDPRVEPIVAATAAATSQFPAWSVRDRNIARVAAWMGQNAVTTLREVTSELDMPEEPTYADSSQTPLRYSLCYRGAMDKISAAVCNPDLARVALPPVPDEPTVREDTEAAAAVLSETMALRLEYAHAAANEFEDFARYVRLRRPPWPPSQARRAAAETYAAVLATTITRTENAKWSAVHAFPAVAWDERASSALADDADIAFITADPQEVRSGLRISADREVRMDPGDLMTAIASWAPGHVSGFLQLDLETQHEYMDRTLYRTLRGAMGESLFVNCLERPGADGKGAGGHWRPLSLTGGAYDPSEGSMFSLAYSDWREGRLSNSDPLKPWEEAGIEVSVGLTKIRAAIPSQNTLAALTVLARTCIPPKALAAMWTAMRPDDADDSAATLTFDDLMKARACSASHVTVTETISEPGLARGPAPTPPLRRADAADSDGPPPEERPLYEATGKMSTFTIVSAPPTAIARVNAMDVAVAATLFGARIVVAAECPGAYSAKSGLTLCIRLFDSRDGSAAKYIDPSVVSTDILSWGRILLSADHNIIENACLSAQLEDLSALLAAKPLASAPPCLLIAGEGMSLKRVLWAKHVPSPPPSVRLIFDSDAVIDELPYVDLATARRDSDARVAPQYESLMSAAGAVASFKLGKRGYPAPKYRGVVEPVTAESKRAERDPFPYTNDESPPFSSPSPTLSFPSPPSLPSSLSASPSPFLTDAIPAGEPAWPAAVETAAARKPRPSGRRRRGKPQGSDKIGVADRRGAPAHMAPARGSEEEDDEEEDELLFARTPRTQIDADEYGTEDQYIEDIPSFGVGDTIEDAWSKYLDGNGPDSPFPEPETSAKRGAANAETEDDLGRIPELPIDNSDSEPERGRDGAQPRPGTVPSGHSKPVETENNNKVVGGRDDVMSKTRGAGAGPVGTGPENLSDDEPDSFVKVPDPRRPPPPPPPPPPRPPPNPGPRPPVPPAGRTVVELESSDSETDDDKRSVPKPGTVPPRVGGFSSAPRKNPPPAPERRGPTSWKSVSNVSLAVDSSESSDEGGEAPEVDETKHRHEPPKERDELLDAASDTVASGGRKERPAGVRFVDPEDDDELEKRNARGIAAGDGSAWRDRPRKPIVPAAPKAPARKPTSARTVRTAADAPSSDDDVYAPPREKRAEEIELPPSDTSSEDESYSSSDDDDDVDYRDGAWEREIARDAGDNYPKRPDRDEGGSGKNSSARAKSSKLIKTDDLLLDRRGFRAASRGAIHYLMRACLLISNRITQVRKELIDEHLSVSAELAKIRMILVN